jgi:hypothetical protein
MPSTNTVACEHVPPCAPALDDNAIAAVVVARHVDEQGWSRLCNGVILFDDGAALLPDGRQLSESGCSCAAIDYWTALLREKDFGILWQSSCCARCTSRDVPRSDGIHRRLLRALT